MAPTQRFYSDITYIPTQEGFVYLAATIDAFTRRCAGWCIRDHMETFLVKEAAKMAFAEADVTDSIHLSEGDRYWRLVRMPRARKVVYPSDLSDDQWRLVAPVLREACGRSGRLPRRELLNAIFYVLKTGVQWRYLPQSYPHWTAVYSCFRRWSHNGTWDKVVESLRVEMRYSQGRTLPPSAAIIDTQTVKTTENGGQVDMMALKS